MLGALFFLGGGGGKAILVVCGVHYFELAQRLGTKFAKHFRYETEVRAH